MTSVSAEKPADHQPRGKRRLVVYIEDNPSDIALIKDLLADFENVDLITAATAETGLAIVRARLPDVVIMDVHLPGMSGLEATERLRGWPDTRAIPVIGLSAAARVRDAVPAAETRFHRFLDKPFKLDELVKTLDALLCLTTLP